MKEQLHTIPISDAMANAGECPFCYIEQKTEEHMMDFVLGHGASYMEADIRDMTDREGFCRAHFKKMFDYGNSLGNAWILKTLMKQVDSCRLIHSTMELEEPSVFLPNRLLRFAAASGRKDFQT